MKFYWINFLKKFSKFCYYSFFCLFSIFSFSCSPDRDKIKHQIQVQNNYFETISDFQIIEEQEIKITYSKIIKKETSSFEKISNGNYQIKANTFSKLILKGDIEINYLETKKIKIIIHQDGRTSFQLIDK